MDELGAAVEIGVEVGEVRHLGHLVISFLPWALQARSLADGDGGPVTWATHGGTFLSTGALDLRATCAAEGEDFPTRQAVRNCGVPNPVGCCQRVWLSTEGGNICSCVEGACAE